MYDALLCVFGHKHQHFILDTYQAACWSCNPRTTKVVVCVDHNPSIADWLSSQIGAENVWNAPFKTHWPVILPIIFEAINEFGKRFQFDHFIKCDYDTVMIGRGCDALFLSQIRDAKIGAVGGYHLPRCPPWGTAISNFLASDGYRSLFGDAPIGYKSTETLSGPVYLLTRAFLSAWKWLVSTQPPSTGIFYKAGIGDELLVLIICRLLGLVPTHLAHDVKVHLPWRESNGQSPCGMEKQGYKITHGVRRWANHDTEVGYSDELGIRNYFRMLRGDVIL